MLLFKIFVLFKCIFTSPKLVLLIDKLKMVLIATFAVAALEILRLLILSIHRENWKLKRLIIADVYV